MIVSRYLTKEVCTTLLANTLILLLIFMGNQFVHYMRIAIAGNLTAHLVTILLLLRMPQLLGTALPLSLFLSIILSYGRMYADNEMTILFASGVTFSKIIKITFITTIGVVVLICALILWASPHINKYVNDLLHKGAISPLELVAPGRFQSTPDGRWILYSETVSSDHKNLQKVFVADPPEQVNAGILMAESAHQKFDDKTEDLFLVFNNGNRYIGKPGEKKYQIITFKQYGSRIGQSNELTTLHEDAKTTKSLWQNYNDKQSAAELQWRLSIPIMALILTLLAIPLSRIKSRQNRYVQLVPAILLFILYGNFLYLGRDWIRAGTISIKIGMWWTHVVMFLIAVILIMIQTGYWHKLLFFHHNKK